MLPAPPPFSHGDFVGVLSRCATLAHLKQLHAHSIVTARAATQPTTSPAQAYAQDALALFLRMLRRGRSAPNQFVYPLVLRAACVVGVQLVRSIHSHAYKSGFHAHDVIRTSLLDGYSRYGMMLDARKLFDGLTERNVVSWTALLSGYTRAGKV